MRWTWLLCTAPFALAPFACASSFSTESAGGGGATSSSTAVTSSSAGGAGGFTCTTPMDCPPPTSQCETTDCVQGQCVRNPLAANTPVPNPIVGNCTAEICDGSGKQTTTPDPKDTFDDGNACTQDVCVNSTPKNNPQAGQPCHDASDARLKVCDDSGACVECNVPGDCSSHLCVAKHCILAECQDMLLDNGESDVDCGGPNCQPCGNGKLCNDGGDCTSGVCGGASPMHCQPPSCTDNVQNQDETDVDCGGTTCNPCGNGKGCAKASDCVSLVCNQGSCAIPTCTDGKANGGESDVDCGGATMCMRCPDGDKCTDDMDCVTACDNTNHCNHCVDNKTDFGETDVDCGGPDCPHCGPGQTCHNDNDCDGSLHCCPGMGPGNPGTCQTHCD